MAVVLGPRIIPVRKFRSVILLLLRVRVRLRVLMFPQAGLCLSEIYMTSSGKVLHGDPDCTYLSIKTHEGRRRKSDLTLMKWFTVCSNYCNQRSKFD